MQDLHELWKRLHDEGLTVKVFCELLMLKLWDEDFRTERQEIRMDFLVRGICEREVDGLLEDPGLYRKTYLPPACRWESIKKAMEEEGDQLIFEFIPLMNQIIIDRFPAQIRTEGSEELGGIPRRTLVDALEQLDHYSLTEKNQMKKFIKDHWPA
ncbi:hypothetical protein [Falsibacillus pallidus]|uniref:hypothetical protein n=1 Tax=Falsibacillus pallidus TaxID=493781 RepID=UPI003D976A02